MDSGCGSPGCHRQGVDRFLADLVTFWRSMDSHRTGGAGRRFGDGRTWRMVHRCPALRQETHRYAGTLMALFLPLRSTSDLTILVMLWPAIRGLPASVSRRFRHD